MAIYLRVDDFSPVLGPFATERVEQMLREGRFDANAQVSNDKKTWYPCGRTSAFAHIFDTLGPRPSDNAMAEIAEATSLSAQAPAPVRLTTGAQKFSAFLRVCPVIGLLAVSVGIIFTFAQDSRLADSIRSGVSWWQWFAWNLLFAGLAMASWYCARAILSWLGKTAKDIKLNEGYLIKGMAATSGGLAAVCLLLGIVGTYTSESHWPVLIGIGLAFALSAVAVSIYRPHLLGIRISAQTESCTEPALRHGNSLLEFGAYAVHCVGGIVGYAAMACAAAIGCMLDLFRTLDNGSLGLRLGFAQSVAKESLVIAIAVPIGSYISFLVVMALVGLIRTFLCIGGAEKSEEASPD